MANYDSMIERLRADIIDSYGNKKRKQMNTEYDGWIPISERYPPIDKDVLIAYKNENEDECETLISRYSDFKIGSIISVGMMFNLPQYYKQNNVIAWRRLPILTYGNILANRTENK